MLKTETSETLASARTIHEDLGSLIDAMPSFARRLAGLEEAVAEEKKVPREKTPASFRRITAWSTGGLGVAATVAGGYLAYQALDYKTSTVDPARAAYEDETVTDFGGQTPEDYYAGLYAVYETLFSDFKGRALTSLTVSGAGLLSLGASVFLFLMPEKPKTEMSFLLLPLPEACSFRVSLRY